jgi:hypothetical protein
MLSASVAHPVTTTLVLLIGGVGLLGYGIYSRARADAPARAPRLDLILGSLALLAGLVHVAR